MLHFNNKIGKYKNYYNMLFISSLKSYNVWNNQLIKKNIKNCNIVYPIFYKRMSFFMFHCMILKKRKFKQLYNINQTLILEGFISRKKCFISIPIFSLNIKIY